MSCLRRICCCGSISPVKATDDMTQSVGVRDGQLYTKPGGGGESSVNPIPKTATMTQPVGVDPDGKLFTKPSSDINPTIKTADMTQPVGVDSIGKLYTKPTNVDPESKTPLMTQSVGVDASGKLYTYPSEPIILHDNIISYDDLIYGETHAHFVIRDDSGFDLYDDTYYIHGLVYIADNGKIYGWAINRNSDNTIFVELEYTGGYWVGDEIV